MLPFLLSRLLPGRQLRRKTLDGRRIDRMKQPVALASGAVALTACGTFKLLRVQRGA